MNMNIENSNMSVDIDEYRFEYNQKEEKDVILHKKSTVNIGEYIFVETIRLFQSDIKYMVNKDNLRIFALSWYRKYLI